MADPSCEIKTLRGALHVHTTCSDGELTPLEVLRVYRELGFDFVALTDHDFIMIPGDYERRGVPDTFEGMIVFKGIEKSVFASGYVHVNQIRGDHEELCIFNHPSQYGLTVKQLVDRIRAIERSRPIHAVEVTTKGFYTAEYDTDEIPYAKVATDDSHTRGGCGRAWVEVACPKQRDAILRAIKEGRAEVCYTLVAHQSVWHQEGGPHRG